MNPIDSQTLEKLEKYIHKTLPDTELKSIEQRIEQEPELKEWLTWLKETTPEIENIVLDDHKAMVKEWLAEEKSTKSISYKLLKPVLIVLAISLIGAIAIIFLQKTSKNNLSTVQIANIHLEKPYKNPTVLRNGNANMWQNSIQLYANGNYEKFLETNAELLNQNQSNNEQKLYFALSNIYKESPDYNKAEEFLSILIDSNTGYQDVALWYRSLVYIKIKDLPKASQDLNRLIERSAYKVEEAKTLLSTM